MAGELGYSPATGQLVYSPATGQLALNCTGGAAFCLDCGDCAAEDFTLDLKFNGDMAELDGVYHATTRDEILDGSSRVAGYIYTMEATCPIKNVTRWLGVSPSTPPVFPGDANADSTDCYAYMNGERTVVGGLHTYSWVTVDAMGAVGDCSLPDTNALEWTDEGVGVYVTTQVNVGCDP